MMAPAAEAMREALMDTTLLAPRVAVVNNVTAQPTSDAEQIMHD